MGPEMIQLHGKDNKKKIDLYYNDVAACEILLELLQSERQFKYRRVVLEELKPNSMLQNSAPFATNIDEYPPEEECASGFRNSTPEEQSSSNSPQQQIKFSSRSDGEEKQSTTSKQPPYFPAINPAFKQHDSYQFYRLVYAATALNEHTFNLKENLPRLAEVQKTYINGILVKSLNRNKMDQVLRELRGMHPKKGTLEKSWEDDFEKAYTDNFRQHVPRPAEVPVVSREWVSNLMRLLGGTEELRNLMKRVDFQLQHGTDNTLSNRKQTHETIVDVVRKKKYRRLYDCREHILRKSGDFLKRNGIEQGQLTAVCLIMIASMFSYDTKEFLLHHILQALQQPTKTNQLFLQCLAAVIKKEQVDLLQYFSTEKQARICVYLLFLHYYKRKENSAAMINVCAKLLGRLAEQQPKFIYLETLNIRRILFMVRRYRLQLDHRAVKHHFEESLQLLFKHSSNQDSFSILQILEYRLYYFQQFKFPLEDKQVAHVEFEQCRQFYSGMDNWDKDKLVMNIYRDENIRVPAGVITSELDSELLRLNKQQQFLYDQGNYRSMMEVRKKMEALEIQQQLQGGRVGFTQRDIGQRCQEARVLCTIGQVSEADRLLRSAVDRVLASPRLLDHRDYYTARARVSMFMNRHQEAHESCIKAIDFNDRLGGDRDQVEKASDLLELQAQICGHLHQYQKSIRILEEMRSELLENKGQMQDYHKLARNYTASANGLYALGKLHDSMALCEKVFELEQKGFIHPHESDFAYLTSTRIYGDMEKPEKQLLHSWKFLQKTKSLGNENTCIVYTNIQRALQPMVGDEALSLISYARKFTSPPRECLKGKYINDRLYESPVPSGLLPLDMPTTDFIKVVRERLREIPLEQHSHCYSFKNELLQVMRNQFQDQPEYRLIYVRTLIEAQLHKYVAGDIEEVMEKLPKVINQMIRCEVAEKDLESKQQLVKFAKDIHQWSIEAAKVLTARKQSEMENSQGMEDRRKPREQNTLTFGESVAFTMAKGALYASLYAAKLTFWLWNKIP